MAASSRLGNLLVGRLRTDYGTLLAARVITSFNHGAFFGVGSIVAAGLVAPQRQAGAVAAMFMGLTHRQCHRRAARASWAGETSRLARGVLGIIAASGASATMAALLYASPTMPPSPSGEEREGNGGAAAR